MNDKTDMSSLYVFTTSLIYYMHIIYFLFCIGTSVIAIMCQVCSYYLLSMLLGD